MRLRADRARIERLLVEFGRALAEPHTLYLVGGASAVVEGWRASTLDVDIRPEPETDALFDAIVDLKRRQNVSIELASPLDFLPELPDWREHSPWLAQHRRVTVRHLDFRLQALAKIERGLDTDRSDVHAMLDRGLVRADELRAALRDMSDQLKRFPSVDPAGLAADLEALIAERNG